MAPDGLTSYHHSYVNDKYNCNTQNTKLQMCVFVTGYDIPINIYNASGDPETLYSYGNTGACVDIIAPGQCVPSSFCTFLYHTVLHAARLLRCSSFRFQNSVVSHPSILEHKHTAHAPTFYFARC